MKPLFLLLPILLFAPGMAPAQDLYSGAVPVEDQSQSAREAAFPLALRQVLGKLSGLRDLTSIEAADGALGAARSLVLSFHYEHLEVAPSGDTVAPLPAGDAGTQTYLVVRFSQAGVDELARGLGLPRWPPARPPLEVWLLIDDGVSRRVMPLEYEFLRPALEQVARERGLPLAWPEPGEEGDYGVDVQLLWGGYTETLAPGETPPNVLVIAARREGPEWNARMILEYAGENRSWRNRHIDLALVLTEAIHQVVDEIVAVQAIAPADQGSWVHPVTISGVTSGEDYERCLAYLQSLSMVDEVAVDGATPGVVRLTLRLNASPEYFENSVARGRVLESGEASGQYVLQQ